MSTQERSKMSKLAILSLILGIFSVFFFVLTGIPAIVIGVVSILKIRRSAGELKGKYIALVGMNISILFMYIFYLFWGIDTPPIPNDYTIADLRSAPPEYAESFGILKALMVEEPEFPGAPAIGLTKKDVEFIDEIKYALRRGMPEEVSKILKQYDESLLQTWDRAQKAREVISQLNEFVEIADLTEPDPFLKPMYTRNLSRLASLYYAYAFLLTEQEDINTFTTQLVEFDSVIRKTTLNVRPFISKLTCNICVSIDIITANAIANNPGASRESIELLARHFKALTDELMSMRNCAMYEYLFTKSFINKGFDSTDVKGRPFFKKNSSIRWYRNLYDVGINSTEGDEDTMSRKFSVWPSIYPFKEPSLFENERPLPLLYRIYNPLGRVFIRQFRVPFKSQSKDPRITSIWIQDDLLQIVLNKRLGNKTNLTARAYGDEYIIDVENRKILSPGPDGKPDTWDDIILWINPEVLGWQN
jgi:hypothetical protein